MLNYFEKKSSLVKLKSCDLCFFFIREEKMEKMKVQKEVNVELFIVE